MNLSKMTQNLEFLSGYTNIIVNIVIILITILNCVVYKFRQDKEAETVEEKYRLKSLYTQGLCNRFSLDQMLRATSNFHDELVLGRGGFGKVYKGTLEHGLTVAIKRLHSMSRQGSTEFQTEIQMLSKLRHSHLVSLIGYCDEGCEMILVYEIMPGGTLADHLHRRDRNGDKSLAPLSWVQRLKICIGAARGLDYLHTGTGIKHRIIHRDVKTTNILLDDNLEAKISDFGLSKTSPANQSTTSVSTHVKGTFGYFDPYYFLTHRLTWRSDVYSLGVVLFEVLCGRPAVDRTLGEEQIGLAGWAQHCSKQGTLEQIIDSRIKGDVFSESLEAFVRVAIQCLQFLPKHRPTMAEIVVSLESALALQEKSTEYYLPEIIIGDDEHQDIDSSEIEAKNENSQEGMVDVSSSRHQEKQSSAIKRFVAFLTIRARAMSVNKDSNSGAVWLPGKKRSSYGSKKKVFANNGGGDSDGTTASDVRNIESLQYDFSTVQVATNYFSDSNKLGEGGFGSVHMGTFQNGQEIAVKRLSRGSNQGQQEFINEVRLVAKLQQKLQHRNLVRLVGFCFEGTERLLIYEFMPNASLDHFIFDSVKRSYLDWEKRYKIISGVARGILYLHEDSRLRIIHRDLKASNVLLDAEMNPKIADFGMARLFNLDETQGITSRITGTYGYMAPEYAMYGQFSVKSDVFSFGVLVLEIISGQKNHNFRNGENVEDLASSAWKNWREGTPSNVIDPILRNSSGSIHEMVRCIHIGLLCVQENVRERPTMASVVLMLNSFSLSLAVPSEPAFFLHSTIDTEVPLLTENSDSRLSNNSKNSTENSAKYSINEASISDLYPR